MYKLFLPMLLLVCQLNALAQDAKSSDLKTTIQAVKVFTQGAQITRGGKATLSVGKQTLVIKSLSPYIDENSIQIKGLGSFTLLSVNHRFNYLGEQKKDATIDSLETILAGLDEKINGQSSMLLVMASKEKMLEENRKIAGAENGLSYEQLSKIVEYFTDEMLSVQHLKYNATTKLNELKVERNKIQNQINQINQRNEMPAGEIVLNLDAKSSSKAEFTVSYFTQNAGWYPKYDIRVDDISAPIQLDYKAEVYQNTMEDWDNVKLSLSNANPNQSGVAPELSPWYLDFYRQYIQPVMRKQSLSAMPQMEAEVLGESFGGRMADANLNESIPLNTTISQSTTTFVIEVNDPYSIKANGEQLTVNLKQYKMDAFFEYYAIPKLDKDAFLIAKIADWNQFNLMPGEANLFFEGTFVGKSTLTTQAISDTLEISLGRDQGISIEREKVDLYSKSNFIGANKVESRGFNIGIRNRKSASIKITVFDQIPVSAISDITVSPTEISSGKLDNQSGKITWVMTIPPASQKELVLKYEVKYPKKERVILE